MNQLKFTLKDFAEFIKTSGEETIIYHHPTKSWWTHFPNDVYVKKTEDWQRDVDTIDAKIAQETDDHLKSRWQVLKESAEKARDSGKELKLCPDGTPVQETKLFRFLSFILERPVFGKNGITAFMCGHADNCEGMITHNWSYFDQKAESELNRTALDVDKICEVIAAEVYKYRDAQVGKSLYQRARIIPIRKQVEIGRNDKCPCGSGLKFKKCHGAEV